MTAASDYRRFIASVPQAQREYRTIEIYHPQFTELLRFVTDFTSASLALEPGAPRNPSETVLFSPLSGRITEPQESGNGVDQILSVDLGAVGGEVNAQIDSISGTGYLTPIEVIYRKYYSGNLSEPVLVLSLSASEVSFDGYTSVSFSAEDSNITTKRAGELYTIERFPTLRGV